MLFKAIHQGIAMKDFLSRILQTHTLQELQDLKNELFGKNGHLSLALQGLSTLSAEEKKKEGEKLNTLKAELGEAFAEQKTKLEKLILDEKLKKESIDVSLPGKIPDLGFFHPLKHALYEISSIFLSMGFSLRSGPDVETDELNFSALNVPEHHPARGMQDTFYLNVETLLRTHTSPVQIRTMRQEGGCLRIIAPGRVYRCDQDPTHSPMFHQIEGLVLGEGLHMGHLKSCLLQFFQRFFGTSVGCRFRPSFFPFTEPSAEVDISCEKTPSGFVVGQGKDWLEVLGCGMVHPEVIAGCGLDPQKVRGFAFGLGIERFAMLRDGLKDLRLFFQNDQRFLRHYGRNLKDVTTDACESLDQ
jgi:phenylalanyl-tRNA synthetase alpha chain